MTISLTHTTVAVGTDAGNGEIAKAQWNEAHTLTMATGKVLGRSTAGDGAVEELSELTLTSGTKTASAPVLNMTQTWNNAAVTFTGLKLNVTDTTSAATSLLMDLQVGGVSKFSVAKSGISSARNVTAGGTTGTGFQILDASGNGVQWALSFSASNNRQAAFLPVGDGNTSMGLRFVTSGTAAIQFGGFSTDGNNAGPPNANYGILIGGQAPTGNGANIPANTVLLTAKAAYNLRLGAADAASPASQTLSVQSVVAGTTNTAGSNLTITGSQSTGSGTAGTINFQTASAGASGTAQNALATVATIGPNTLSGSETTPILNLAQTWNTSGVATGLKLNVTDTASASASLLMDLQVGGTSVAHFTKNGILRVGNASKSGVIHSPNDLSLRSGTGGDGYGGNILTVTSSNLVQIPFGNLSFGGDITLTRRGAANLRFGAADAAAPVAQTLSVQSVVAGTTNTAGANLTITGSQGTGTGAGGSIIFQVAPAGLTGIAQNALATAFVISNSAGGAGWTVGGGPGSSSLTSANNIAQIVGGTSVAINPGVFYLGTGYDVCLLREAANTLALRNGTNAQIFRVYSTYTNASNYERGALNAGADFIELAAETAGTGDDNLDVRLTPAGTGAVRFGTHSAIAAETVTGYIEIKDSSGTVRKIAVVS